MRIINKNTDKTVCEVTTNKSMTIEEALESAGAERIKEEHPAWDENECGDYFLNGEELWVDDLEISTEKTSGERIKKLRNIIGISQTKFGDLYGIPMRTIQNWENGVSEAPGYVVDVLELAVWQTKEKERLFWGVVDYRDGDFEWEEYASKAEALKEGEFTWSNLSAYDQKHREEFYVGLLNENGEACVIAKRWK